MKKTLLLIITAILVSAGIAIYYFATRTNAINILNHIPKAANSVLVIDIKGLATKLAVDEISSSRKSSEGLLNMLPDSLKEIDLLNSGLDLFNKAAIFTVEEQKRIGVQVIFPVADYKQLCHFVDSVRFSHDLKIDEFRNVKYVYSERYSVLAAFSKNIFIATNVQLTELEDEKRRIQKYIKIKPENALRNDSLFVNKLSRGADIFLYSQRYNNVSRKIASLFNKNLQTAYLWMSFEDGEIKANSEINLKEDGLFDKAFPKRVSNLQSIENNDSTGLELVLNMEPDLFFTLLGDVSDIKLNYEKIPIIKAWDGTANLVFNKGKMIEHEYVSYEYDDDFNKIEVKKKVKNKIVDVQANIGIDKGKKDSILKDYKIPRLGKDSLLYPGSNFIISSAGNGCLCYNKNIKKPILMNDSNPVNLSVNLNNSITLSILKELNLISDSSLFGKLNFNRLEFVATKEEAVMSEITLFFEEENKNSFFIVLEQLLTFYKR